VLTTKCGDLASGFMELTQFDGMVFCRRSMIGIKTVVEVLEHSTDAGHETWGTTAASCGEVPLVSISGRLLSVPRVEMAKSFPRNREQ
jgi:hypothetical protein